MVNARKTKRRAAQYTWKVTRRNGDYLSVSADGLGVIDGELVFTTNNVPVRIIAADTYTDMAIVFAAED
jgi:hypothetical protein